MSTELVKKNLTDSKRRATVDMVHAIHRVGRNRWEIISNNMGPDMDIWRNLFEIGKKIENVTDDNKILSKCCGEETYLVLRTEFVDQKILPSIKETVAENKTKKNDKKQKPLKKIDKMKQENQLKKIKSETQNVFKIFTQEPMTNKKEISFTGKYVEIILLKLIVQGDMLAKKYTNLKKQLETKSKSKYTPEKEIIQLKLDIDECVNEMYDYVMGCTKIVKDKQKNGYIVYNLFR